MARQLAELLQLSLEEVCADFDTMLCHDWRSLGVSALRSLMCFAWQGLLASYPLACFMLLGVTPPLDGRSPSLKHSWKDVCSGGPMPGVLLLDEYAPT